MKKKSSKLASLERNRFSVFTKDLKHCYLCGNKRDDLHEIFAGRNRINSMKYGFVLPLCRMCHTRYQNDFSFNRYWYQKAEKYFLDNIGMVEDFIKIFRKNYL